MKKYQTINHFDEIEQADWDQLLDKNNILSPFLKYGFQRTWWKHLGGGEWENAELLIITASENEKLAAIAPMFLTHVNGEKEIHFIGSYEICDYLDFIVSPACSQEFIEQALRIASDHLGKESGRIVLFNIPQDSPTISALEKINASSDTWDIHLENAYHTPIITLADDWETYLMGIDSKQRHEIRRKIRRSESSQIDKVAWHIVGEDDDLDQAIADFLAMMENDPEKEMFLTKEMRKQMVAIMRWAAKESVLQLAFLTINQKKAAGYISFDHADRIWVYNSGYNLGFRQYSPGWVLLSYLIQHAINSGRTHFDFMRGDEKYKYKFGAQDDFVKKAVIIRKEV